MSINSRIIEAVTPLVPVCVPDLYDGDAEIYCTFNGTETPDGFGDDGPQAIRWLMQLHLFAPRRQNVLGMKRSLCRRLWKAGFTYPSVANASDSDGQHYVLEFEELDGDV